jgi:hypothetical protein
LSGTEQLFHETKQIEDRLRQASRPNKLHVKHQFRAQRQGSPSLALLPMVMNDNDNDNDNETDPILVKGNQII